MKFNPITKELFTDDGEFIKELACPISMQWNQLERAGLEKGRRCTQCSRVVLDSGRFADRELLLRVQSDPDACLNVDLNQANLSEILFQRTSRNMVSGKHRLPGVNGEAK